MQRQGSERGVDADGGRPRGAVGGPVHGRIALQGIVADQGQVGLSPGRAVVRRVELRLRGESEVVRGGDDLLRVRAVDPDRRLAARRGLGPGDALLAALAGAPGNRFQSARRRRLARLEVLVGDHPLMDVAQEERVPAGRVARQVAAVRVVLAPEYPQPGRQLERVGGLLGAEEAEILVLGDQLRERAARQDVVRLQLLVQPWPAARQIGNSLPAWTGGCDSGRRQRQCRHRDEHQANHQPGIPFQELTRSHWLSSPFDRSMVSQHIVLCRHAQVRRCAPAAGELLEDSAVVSGGRREAIGQGRGGGGVRVRGGPACDPGSGPQGARRRLSPGAGGTTPAGRCTAGSRMSRRCRDCSAHRRSCRAERRPADRALPGSRG